MSSSFALAWGHLRLIVIPVFFCFALLAVAGTAPSTAPVQKNILIINEVGITNPASAVVTQGLLSAVTDNRDYHVGFYVESLDTPAFADVASERKMQSWLVDKYRDRKVDVIVAMGPNPITFMSRFADTFLPDIPVVICGSSEAQAGYPKLTSRFTGSWLKLEPTKTIDAVLKLLPGTQQAVVVGGSSIFDRTIEAITKASLHSYPAPLAFTYLTDLDMPTLLERLRHLPPRTIVLYMSLFRDSAGNQFVNATTALPLVSEASNAPVFGMSDTYLGRGIVGGYVLNYAEQGKIAAGMISEIFGGKQARDIPIQTVASSYIFDWTQLKRWKVADRELPVGSILLYRPPTLWERAKWILVGGSLLFVGLASLVGYLLYKQRQLNRSRREQMRLSGMLINAQEDERKRLASELHDDFSQRLALLSLGLETAAELVPDSPKEANEQLHELLNSASEIGADLHTLSHRLHSSTLERLGLVPGIGAYCKEFSAQQGVQVVFTHNGRHDGVSTDVALCLFRIVQEGLRNLKKHSGASKAQVALEHIDGNLHLSISDDGAGFDVNEATRRQGLGLFSMAERARLIGARFEIHSEIHKGTRIDVWVREQQEAKTESPDVVVQPVIHEMNEFLENGQCQTSGHKS